VGDIATVDILRLRSVVRKFTVTQNQAITVPTSEHQRARPVSDQRVDQQRLHPLCNGSVSWTRRRYLRFASNVVDAQPLPTGHYL
jgi:hypothetical protein